MRIAVNGKVLVRDQREGIGWFAKSLIESTAAAFPNTQWTILHPAHQRIEPSSLPNIHIQGLSYPFRSGRRQWKWPEKLGLDLPWWIHQTLPQGLIKQAADVFFSPDGIAPRRKICPTVLTIHDLAPLRVPEFMRVRDKIYYRSYLPPIARRSDAVITVSDFSRQEIKELLKIPSHKISVVHNVVRIGFKPLSAKQKSEVCLRYSEGRPYLLYVGAIHPRKNLMRLVHAYERFRTMSDKPVKLIIAGAKGWDWHALFDKMAQSPFRQDIHWLGYLPEVELYRLTASAEAAVNLSMYEGFGMPLVEAMACHVPVLCADKSAYPEVTNGAALLTNPDNIREISESIHAIVHDESLRNRLIKSGIKRSSEFHWRGAAEVFYQTLQMAASNKIS